MTQTARPLRILFLTHAFNSLAQRLYVELSGRGHEVSIEFDINDAVTIEAVALFRPDLIIAPFLKRAIPAEIWQEHVCLVVHPGIVGDRGPSALDWAIMNGEAEWGVTVLQANAAMDGGDIWAARGFPMRAARKSSLYRNEVTEAAAAAVLEAVEKFGRSDFRPAPLDYADPAVRGRERPLMTQAQRRIDWARDDTATVLRKIRAADSFPGVADCIAGVACWLFNAHAESVLRGAYPDAPPGAVIAQRQGALCRATTDGAVWITHARRKSDPPGFKLPAARAIPEAAGAPESALPALPWRDANTWQDIAYEEEAGVGYLHFDFYNGAMSTADCLRLRDAFIEAARRDVKVIALMGGPDFWSNGIHLNTIEAADSPADESWANIEAMDDLCRAILACGDRYIIAAMRGNAGAGGVFLALTADRVLAREGVVLNPHYKGMGNLYGSEYWTYLLPRRVGEAQALAITQNRLPLGARQAAAQGLIDACFGADAPDFTAQVKALAADLAARPDDLARLLEAKRADRACDEAVKPLAAYRAEELERMRLNFYGFDPSYHVARYHFVHRLPHAWTPLHLARHRRNMWQRQAVLKTRDAVSAQGRN
ncbi:MAG: hydrogenase maturation protein [Zoogloeaceae bacterium]|jgi:putative two-component system hydrogenase maturation factor HypX/HoxX|nr:hydrogenase maturation protein [Zoogloeaceae bacterium]